MRVFWAVVILGLVAACAPPPPRVVTGPPPEPEAPSGAVQTRVAAGSASDSFAVVVRRVEPVAEALCAERLGNGRCNFKIVLDTRPGVPANAFQTLDAEGRPVLIVTRALLDELQNAHEAAFVLGHEAAHHIEGHIPRSQTNSVLGAVAAGELARVMGASGAQIAQAQELGAFAGQRQFSKSFELEADRLGTVIAWGAGYDPVAGAQYFARIPDPGDMFLGTHPPNADRMRIVRQTAAELR